MNWLMLKFGLCFISLKLSWLLLVSLELVSFSWVLCRFFFGMVMLLVVVFSLNGICVVCSRLVVLVVVFWFSLVYSGIMLGFCD